MSLLDLPVPYPVTGARLVTFVQPEDFDHVPSDCENPTQTILDVMQDNPGAPFVSADFVPYGITSGSASEILGRLYRAGKLKSAGVIRSAKGRPARSYFWDGV